MEILDYDRAITFRTTSASMRAIDSVVFKVKGEPDVAFRTRAPSKEAIINASWLYLNELPEDELMAIFREYLPKLEAAMRGKRPGHQDEAKKSKKS
jgi:hypothetical protein